VKSFGEIIDESVIVYFDLDDTLVDHGNRTGIRIKYPNGSIKRLSSTEYSNYVPKNNEKFDWSELRSAKHFHQSARPNRHMIKRLHHASKKHKVEILTGRGDLDDKDLFRRTMGRHGIDINKVHVRRVGNMRDSKTTAQRKAHFVSQAINKDNHREVHLYDDSIENIRAFLALKTEHPKIRFHAFHVSKNRGKISIRRHK